MIKLIGSALVIMATSAIGFQLARAYRERPRELQLLIEALRILRADIEYMATPLPQALANVTTRLAKPLNVLLGTTAEALARSDVTVGEALAAGIEACRPQAHLLESDYEALALFGRTLGTSDLLHQSQQFEATIVQLESIQKEAEEAKRRYERMWQYIGVLTGLFIVILLY
ncbi:stage III sporulation protein SpoIIIAB [Alicyclobacillus mengziensis]|uniref:Stage III sporulation protein AB n=1 Tax=Alicyclobacillus mengziensis TaxID=2931921 RepID=A0A9X7Z509_9BACL|nr:stage III sporulation protein SpoIIIAB [Alicyclobacillus mengziensis]QSO45887.1 stage III sporulation protein AB [Alicyclobacillus mengziensis]